MRDVPMTYRDHSPGQYPGLPDPDERADFYSGVTTKRLLAFLVDLVISFILTLIVLPFTAFTGLFFFPFLFLLIDFIYRWLTISSGSATWGMRLMAVELRDGDGMKLSGTNALLHTAGFSISMGVMPVQVISVLLMILSGRKQGLTDHVLGTAMINKPA